MPVKRELIPSDAVPSELILQHCSDILMHPNMQVEASCKQHGTTSVLAHSAAVTAAALIVARDLRIPVDVRALARAALLHDYFLYDWHVGSPENKLHAFTHPYRAARNAMRDHALTKHERFIVRTHMFPMVPVPPTSREAWIVCLVDKAIATHETLKGFARRDARRHTS